MKVGIMAKIENNLQTAMALLKETQELLTTIKGGRFYVYVTTVKKEDSKEYKYVGIRNLPARYASAEKDQSWFGAEINKKIKAGTVDNVHKKVIKEFLTKEEALRLRDKTVNVIKKNSPDTIVEFCTYSKVETPLR